MIDRIKEKNVILKIAAIVMIIINGISLLSALFLYAGSAELNAKAAALGIDGVPVSMYMTAIFGSLIYVLIGLFGLFAKTRKSLIISGIVIVVVCVISILNNIIRSGFTLSYLLGIVVPAVYLYGAYKQPEEQEEATVKVTVKDTVAGQTSATGTPAEQTADAGTATEQTSDVGTATEQTADVGTTTD